VRRFIHYDLFNDGVSRSGSKASNDKMVYVMTQEGCGGTESWLSSRYCPSIFLEALRKTKKFKTK
jgi:hypothetical protein